MRFILFSVITYFLIGCATSTVDKAIDYHAKAAPYVKMGMSEQSFLSLMEPAIAPTLKNKEERQPRRFSKGEKMYVVHFIRVARVPDEFYTDDEYRPYIFADGKLVAVGWRHLGGEKFTSQDLKQRAASANKTNVNVRQSTTVNSNTAGGGFCVPDLNGDGRCMGARCC